MPDSRLVRTKLLTSRKTTKQMRRNGKIRVALIALFFVVTFAAGCSPHRPPATNGPPGWVHDNGVRAKVSDYKGKVVLLDFYATWCEPCRYEMPRLVALHQRLESQGLQIIGLNVGGADDHEQVPAFAQEFGIQFPLAIPDDEFVEEYLGINQDIPQTFVIDRQGRVVKRFIGYSEESAEELERVIQATLAQK